MSKDVLDIVMIIDISSKDDITLSAIKENIKEIVSELESSINTISLISFDNTPKVIEKFQSVKQFDVNKLSVAGGGMSNVHLALKQAVELIHSIQNELSCIILYLSRDGTDYANLLSDKDINILGSVQKFLVRRGSSLIEPKGFAGCYSYVLGTEQDIKSLVIKLKGLCRQATSSEDKEVAPSAEEIISFSPDADSHQRDKNTIPIQQNNALSYTSEFEPNDNKLIDDLPSPDIYN